MRRLDPRIGFRGSLIAGSSPAMTRRLSFDPARPDAEGSELNR
jgi:hypothetical protein